MLVSWVRDGNTMYGCMSSGTEYFMVVEKLPDQTGWDWVTWRKNDVPARASHGVSRSIIEAMTEAEARVTADQVF